MARKRYTIEDMKTLAKSRGGRCLSVRYVSTDAKLVWQCSKGHAWAATPGNVIHQHSWCPRCAQNVKGTIGEMRALAKSKGGKCISTKYMDRGTPLEWQCSEGHKWWAAPGNIKSQDQWCRKCAIERRAAKRRLGIEAMRSLAQRRGGKCVSDIYVNSATTLEWECGAGHRWKEIPDKVKNQEKWCPYCLGTGFITEAKCRYIIEILTGELFSKTQTVLGQGYELDGYSEVVKVAFEYNGEHHYKIVRRYTPTRKRLRERKRLRRWKKRRCDAMGIVLVSIPYTVAGNVRRLQSYIERQLSYYGVPFKEDEVVSFDNFCCDYSRLKDVQEIAEAKGGSCVSSMYLGVKEHLTFCCGNGHTWPATPNDIKNGTWCPVCQHRVPLTLEKMRLLAKSHNGVCLSRKIVDAQTVLKWRCQNGHVFKMTPGNVKYNGHWCPQCAGVRDAPTLAEHRKLRLREFKKIARARGGCCLSAEYLNTKQKLQFKCSEGHIFFARPDDVKNKGTWCKKCSHEQRATKWSIHDMRELATKKGGECVSRKYVNNKTQLRWRCSQGHEWPAIPANVLRGAWCRACAARERGQKLRRRNAVNACHDST